MKKAFKKLLITMMVLSLLLTVIGCGSKGETSGGESSVQNGAYEDDDFFGESVESIETGVKEEGFSQIQSGTISNSQMPTAKEQNNYWKKMLKEMPSNLRGKTIKVYNWNPMSDYPGLSKVIQKFTKETGIKVTWQTENYDTYISKLTSMTAANKAPDIVRMHTGAPQVWNTVQPISTSGYKDFSNAVWDQSYMDVNTVNGKVYSTNTTATMISSYGILFYNRSYITKYDLSDPYKLWKEGKWTIEEFEKIMRTYTKATGKPAWAAQSGGIGRYLSQMNGYKGEIYFNGKNYVSSLNDSKVVSIIQHVLDMKNTEHLITAANVDYFDKGETIFFDGTSCTVKTLNAYASTLKTAGTLGTVPYPAASGKKYSYAVYNDEGFGIAKGAKCPEAFPYYVFYVTNQAHYDLDTFYPDAQAKEVCNFMLNMPKEYKISSVGWDKLIHQFYYGDSKAGDSIYDSLKDCTASQVASAITANSNLTQRRIEEYNKLLQKLK